MYANESVHHLTNEKHSKTLQDQIKRTIYRPFTYENMAANITHDQQHHHFYSFYYPEKKFKLILQSQYHYCILPVGCNKKVMQKKYN